MYKSQWEQDYLLNRRFFKNKFDGFFVDVGAHDGIKFSNSYFFEKTLGWKGICVEPLSKAYNELIKNRNCICINGCAYYEDTIVDFIEIDGYSEMLSGISTDYDVRHATRVNGEVRKEGGNIKMKKTNAYRLSTLFERYNIRKIDYLTIDTEGSEFSVLKGIDFDKVKIDVIDVENNYPDRFKPVEELLLNQNFIHVDSIGGDEIFVHENVLISL